MMGLTLSRLWSFWVPRVRRRRLSSRSSSERSFASSNEDDDSRESLTEDVASLNNGSFPLQERELPILDGGCPISALPQDLLLRYIGL